MKYEYNYYTTDESFDYGDWSWGGTWNETGYHGFEVEIDSNDKIDISTLTGYGDFSVEVENIKTLSDFKNFLIKNEKFIEEIDEDSTYSNYEIFEELKELVCLNILNEEKAA